MKLILRRNFLISIVGLFSFLTAQSQSQYSNLEKYWKYRERLRDKFVYVSDSVENFGVNLPAVKIDYSYSETYLRFGDNNARSELYLSLLSTELYLLKKMGVDYSETLKELYYALLAIERLDLYSETYEQVADEEGWINGSDWDDSKIDINDLNVNDINGYFIRDDVTQSFWDKYSSYFGFDRFESHLTRDSGIYFMEPISQDNIFNLLQGLALTEALVGVEDVSSNPAVFNTSIIPTYLSNKNIKNGNLIDFAEWARDLTLRLTKYMQPSLNISVPETWRTWFYQVFVSDWYLVDSRGELVPEGNGLLELGSFFHWPIIDNAVEVTGLPESTVRDNDGENFGLSVYKESFEDGSTPVFGVLMNDAFDWDEEKEQKTRSLGALADILHGIITLDALRDLRDTHESPLEHLPLIYMIVHRDKYELREFFTYGSNAFVDEMEIYTELLDLAQQCGPHGFKNRDDFEYEWSAVTRYKPWSRIGVDDDSKLKEFSGMDYMVLHNLMYIAFLVNNAQYGTDYISSWDPEVIKGYDIEFAGSVIYDGDLTISAHNSIKLGPGFSVDGSSYFKAEVISPTNYYDPKEYGVITVTPCE